MAFGDTPRMLPFLRGKGSEGGRSPFFDTTSMRVGIQQFTSDFRGFVLTDSNLGARMFGNLRNNRYSTTWSFSTCGERHQQPAECDKFRREQLAQPVRLHRQPLPPGHVLRQGYTLQFSALYNDDQPSTLQDQNGLRARPSRSASHSAPRSGGLFRHTATGISGG